MNSVDVPVRVNFECYTKQRGNLCHDSFREGHNVLTITGKNWLSKLIAWQTIGATDVSFTERRIRWIGLGIGSQLEVPSVSSLAQPTLITPSNYLVPIHATTYPTSTSVTFSREFTPSEINVTGTNVAVTEAALYADVNPATGAGTEDTPYDSSTILNPGVGTNPPIVYKAFEPVVVTVDFTFHVNWTFLF